MTQGTTITTALAREIAPSHLLLLAKQLSPSADSSRCTARINHHITRSSQEVLAQQRSVAGFMDVIAGTKREPQTLQTGARKRQATESSYEDANEMEGDRASNVDLDQEQESSDSNEEELELSELSEKSFEEPNDISEREYDDEHDDDEDYDEFEEFKWLKSVNITIKADDAADSPQVGFCVAKLIDRDYIRATFHRDMEEPSNDSATVGFGVFNRWGCLRPEFLTHPIKKGTGVWGPELDKGRFLLIENLSIQGDYQRRGYGKKLFE